MTTGLADVDYNLTRASEPGRSSQVGPEFGVVCYAPAGNQYGPLASPQTGIPLFEGQVRPLIRGDPQHSGEEASLGFLPSEPFASPPSS